MERSYEEVYAVAEERHPWFVARRDLFAALLGDDRTASVLDVGCGTGILLAHLGRLGYENLAGVEVSANLRDKFRDPTIQVFDQMPEGTYDRILMLDVLEHIEDDEETLKTIHARLAGAGRFLLSVPAHPFLWSRHDEINRHYRRYRRRELEAKLRAAGFCLRRLSYWNMFSFPAVCAVRWLRLERESTQLEVGGALAMRVYGALLSLENRLLRRMSLPMGVSLIAVAVRADAEADEAGES